jgi:hypothetical protein
MLNTEVAKVRCRSCYHEHNYLHEQIPPSKKELKKMELFNEVLAKVDSTASQPVDGPGEPERETVETSKKAKKG